MATVRDKLWMWGHNVGVHDSTSRWKLPANSRMTPVEGAVYMGVPNIIMVWVWRAERPEPEPSWEQYALPFRALDRVVWSVGHGHGLNYANHVFALAEKLPNMDGVILDDFFTTQADGYLAALRPDQLAEVRRRLVLPSRRLDLWACVYEQDLDKPIEPILRDIDVMCFATWTAENLARLDENFEKLERMTPDKRKVLLLYMWDYAGRRPLPLDVMRMQCETGLRWLREGRADGLVFLATCICDMGLETVEWARQWIAGVADEEL